VCVWGRGKEGLEVIVVSLIIAFFSSLLAHIHFFIIFAPQNN